MLNGVLESSMVLKTKYGLDIRKIQFYKGQEFSFDLLFKRLQCLYEIKLADSMVVKYRDGGMVC